MKNKTMAKLLLGALAGVSSWIVSTDKLAEYSARKEVSQEPNSFSFLDRKLGHDSPYKAIRNLGYCEKRARKFEAFLEEDLKKLKDRRPGNYEDMLMYYLQIDADEKKHSDWYRSRAPGILNEIATIGSESAGQKIADIACSNSELALPALESLMNYVDSKKKLGSKSKKLLLNKLASGMAEGGNQDEIRKTAIVLSKSRYNDVVPLLMSMRKNEDYKGIAYSCLAYFPSSPLFYMFLEEAHKSAASRDFHTGIVIGEEAIRIAKQLDMKSGSANAFFMGYGCKNLIRMTNYVGLPQTAIEHINEMQYRSRYNIVHMINSRLKSQGCSFN